MISMLTKNKQEHYVYRYVLNNTQEIIYVGKTDASLKQRIDAHEVEPKFQPYLGRWRVEFIELANSVETDIVEKFLINSLKPLINEKDCVSGITNMCINLPEWHPYSEYEAKMQRNRKEVNRAQVAKLCEVLKDIVQIDGNKIILPDIFTAPIYFRGKIKELFKKEVHAESAGYEYTLLPGAHKFVVAHMYQMCADAFIQSCADDINANEHIRADYEEYAIAKEIAGILWEFKKDHFWSDLGMCTLLLPEKCWECAENFAGIISPICEGIYAVNPDEYAKVNGILEHLAYCCVENSESVKFCTLL